MADSNRRQDKSHVGENQELMARGIYFRKLWLEEIHGSFELVFMLVSARGFALFTQQNIGQFRKGLELYHKLCISGNKIRWNLQLVGFSYGKKSANVVMWKDKEYEYISSA